MEMMERILLILSERGIPYQEFYKAIGVDRTTFYRWREKNVSVSLKNIEKIADYLTVSVDFLLGKSYEVQSGTAKTII